MALTLDFSATVVATAISPTVLTGGLICPGWGGSECQNVFQLHLLSPRLGNAVTDLTLGNSTKLRSEVVADVARLQVIAPRVP